MANTLAAGVPSTFEVTFEPGLSVAMKIRDTSAGLPGTLVATIPMTDDGEGLYAADFTPVSGKRYTVKKAVYMDGTYVTRDPNYSGGSESFRASDLEADIAAIIAILGAPAGASVSADIASVKQDSSDVAARLSTARAIKLDHLDADITSRATQTSVNAIPTNPLLTSDVRLAHLDADISSREPSSDPRLDHLDVDVSTRATQASVDTYFGELSALQASLDTAITTLDGDIASISVAVTDAATAATAATAAAAAATAAESAISISTIALGTAVVNLEAAINGIGDVSFLVRSNLTGAITVANVTGKVGE